MDTDTATRTAAAARGATERKNETASGDRAEPAAPCTSGKPAVILTPRLAGPHRVAEPGVPAHLGSTRRPPRMGGLRLRRVIRPTAAGPRPKPMLLACAHTVLGVCRKIMRSQPLKQTTRAEEPGVSPQKTQVATHLPPSGVPQAPAAAGRGSPPANTMEP